MSDRPGPLRDLAVTLRPATADDAEAIVELYEQLGARSRLHRFLMPVRTRDRATLARLTAVDGIVAWLAFDGDRCVGEARVAPGSGCGELAVTVADSHQGLGLGSRLARLAVSRHFENHDCVAFTVHPDNMAALTLARRGRIGLRSDSGLLRGVVVKSRVRARIPSDSPAVANVPASRGELHDDRQVVPSGAHRRGSRHH